MKLRLKKVNIVKRKLLLPLSLFIGVCGTILFLYYVNIINRTSSPASKGASPIAEYHFNEGQGSYAQDASSNNNDLTLTSTTWAVETAEESQLAYSLGFNGTTSQATRATDTDFDFGSGSFTINGWFRHSSNITGTNIILARYSTAGYKIYLNSSGYLCFDIDSDGTWGSSNYDTACSTATQGSYADSKWHNFNAVRNGATSITLYVDGMQVAQDATIAAGSLNATATLYIGVDSDGSSNDYAGFLDEIYIYNYANDVDQVKANYTGTQVAAQFGSMPKSYFTDGLVGYWKMDENTGTSTIDSSGNGNNSTSFTGSPTWVIGKYVSSLLFNGTSQYITLADNASLNVSTEFTFSTWIKRSALGNSEVFYESGIGGLNHWRLGFSDTNYINFEEESIGDNLSTVAITDTTSWHHVVIIKNGDSGTNINFYLDGAFAGSASVGTVTVPVGVKYFGQSAGASYFHGSVDDSRLYNRALSPTEVTKLYQYAPGPIAYWKFDEGSGTVANDISGNGNNATFASGTSAPTWNQGKFGKGLSFSLTSTTTTLTIQPDSSTDKDTCIYQGAPTTPRDGSTDILTGRDDNTFRSLLQFDVSSIPSSAVCNSATLTLTIIGANDYGTNRAHSIYEIRSDRNDWTAAAATWNNYKSGTPWGTAGAANTSTDRLSTTIATFNAPNSANTSVDIALACADVADWFGASNQNYGLLIKSDTDGDNWTYKFYASAENATASYRPKLAVNYTTSSGQHLATSNTALVAGDSTTYNQIAWGGWFKPVVSSASKTLIQKNNEFQLTTDSSSQPNCAIYSGSWQNSAVSSTALPLNTWSHVMCTYDGVNLKVFINGAQTGTVAQTNNITSTNTTALNIGRDSAGNRFYEGIIDDVRVYNYTRTPTQIVQDMNAGHPTPGSPIGSAIIDWKMDEGYGSYTNNTGNTPTLDGTISGAVWSTDAKYGKSLYLDTGTDYVSAGDVSFVDALSQMTVSMWLKADSLTTDDFIAQKWNLAANQTSFRIATGSSNADELRFAISSSVTDNESNLFTTTNADLANSTWYHLTFVYDGTQAAADRIKVYKNATLLSGTVTGTIPATMDSGSTSNLGLGDIAGNSQALLGRYDDFKIYTTALSAEQVKVEYNKGKATGFGSLSTDASGNPDNSAAREYCIPGDTTACSPPVAHWKMDEHKDQTVQDISGNNLSGTLGNTTTIATNDPTWVPGKFGSGLNFDGINDYVRVAENDLLHPTNDMTISAWIKMDRLPSVVGNTFWLLVKNHSVSPWSSYYLTINTSNQFATYWLNSTDTDSYADTYTTSTLSANTWYYVTLVRDGTVTRNYVNGVPDLINRDVSGVILNTDSPLFVGGNASASSAWFEGQMDDIILYDYARTPAQIAWDMNRGAPIAHYKFDECSGTTAYDTALKPANSTTLRYNGTIVPGGAPQSSVGDCTTSATTMWYNGRTGKYNGSLSFDGTDDTVTIPDPGTNSSFDLTNQFTLSGWAKFDSLANPSQIVVAKIATLASGNVNYALSTAVAGYEDEVSCSIMTSGMAYGRATRADGDTVDLQTGVWYHLACTFDNNTDRLRIYVNGIKKVDRTDYTYTPSVGNDSTYIAGSPGGGYLDGQIDDVRIYNYALTDTQIKQLYNNDSSVMFN